MENLYEIHDLNGKNVCSDRIITDLKTALWTAADLSKDQDLVLVEIIARFYKGEKYIWTRE